MSPLHTAPDGRPIERHRPFGGPVLALAVVLGWLAHDALMFALCGEPKLMLEGLPRTIVILVVSGAVGFVLRLVPELLAALLVGAGAAALALPRIGLGLGFTESDHKFSAAVFALALGLGLGSLLHRFFGTGAARTGVGCGALACVIFWWFQRDLEAASFWFAGAAAAVLLLGFVRWPLWRLFGTLVAAGLLVWLVLVPVVRDAPRVLVRSSASEGALATGNVNELPNLVLIVLDTVRAGNLAPYGYGRTTTPRLDQFARNHAVRYTNARSTSSWTLPSHASLFTGLMPAQHGATHVRKGADQASTVDSAALPAQALREDVPTLASILEAQGYRTGAVLANSAYLNARFGLARGFEHYDARPGGFLRRYLPLAQLAGAPLRAGHLLYRDAQTITDLALRWLDGDDGRPFFLAVNYMDAHSPYVPPPPFDRAFGPPARKPLELEYHDRVDQYDRSLLYLDSQLERLLKRLDLPRTLVVITADHGEALGNHGYWMHNWALYDPLVKVPLYVKPLGPRRVTEVDKPVNGAEVFHMILAALGVEGPRPPEDQNLVAEWYQIDHVPESPVLADKHVTRDLLVWLEGSQKVIVSSTGEVEIFDLEQDPGEVRPLEIDAVRRAAALARARSWWQDNPPQAPGEVGPYDPEELERMRALGYLGGDT